MRFFCKQKDHECQKKSDGGLQKKRDLWKKSYCTIICNGSAIVCLSCISNPLPDQGVTILSPTANDVVEGGGDSYEILWKADPAESEYVAMVTIEFSKDGEKSWETVAENVPNSGKYMWKALKQIRPNARSGFFPNGGQFFAELQKCSL